MRPLILAIAMLATSAVTAVAQDDERLDPDAPPSEMREGLRLLEEGTRRLLEGLTAEMEPALDGLGDMIGNLNAYHPPEMLPNGDIIIRRKTPVEMEPEGEIEL